MECIEITKDDRFRATHEIGHVLVLEHTMIDWEYVTILSDDGNKGGCIKHKEIEIIEENCCNYVLFKLGGEAIIRMQYNLVSALASAKYDREDIKKFLKQVNPHISEKRCISRGLAANRQFFRCKEIKGKIDLIVEELLNRKTMTRQEYLDFMNENDAMK